MEICIPAKRSIIAIVFLTGWLGLWASGEVFAIHELFFGSANTEILFLSGWLLMWTAGGAFAVYTWLWMVKGCEIVRLRGDALVIRREIVGLGRNGEYDLRHVRNLRVAPATWNPNDWSSAMQFWGVGGGPIAFDYGSRTFRFGASLDEAEARDIVKELKAQHSFPDVAA